MDKYIIREKSDESTKYNAGSKARNDIDSIAIKNGFVPFDCHFPEITNRGTYGKLKRFNYHVKTLKLWMNQFKKIKDGSLLIIQFPVRAHTLFLGCALKKLKARNIRTIAVIHDMEYIRNAVYYQNEKGKSARLKYEEVMGLKQFSYIVVHNHKMFEYVTNEFNIPADKIIEIGIFDYLIPGYEENKNISFDLESVIIAGNLDKEKCGYVYSLPDNVKFELFGSNYSGNHSSNIHYNGVFTPDQLPFNLRGSYGLVWDGPVIDSCEGIFGNYMKFNNPHKTSLYLACGIPAIVWKEAAISKFIIENKCGIVCDDLNNLSEILGKITFSEYETLRHNANKIGANIRSGLYFSDVISKINEREGIRNDG